MASATKTDFINRVRRLAATYIQASDAFANLVSELTYSGYAEGNLTAADFEGINADITPEQVLLFFATLEELLSPLTPEQKKVIYALKASSQHILPPGV